jgi:hypothetical protein
MTVGSTGVGKFFDFTASDLISAFVQKENNDHKRNLEVLRLQAEYQDRNLSSPMIDSPSVAVDTGYAGAPNASTGMSLTAPWVIVGSAILAISGIFLVLVR